MENYKPNSRTAKSQEKEEPKKEKIEKRIINFVSNFCIFFIQMIQCNMMS